MVSVRIESSVIESEEQLNKLFTKSENILSRFVRQKLNVTERASLAELWHLRTETQEHGISKIEVTYAYECPWAKARVMFSPKVKVSQKHMFVDNTTKKILTKDEVRERCVELLDRRDR